MWGKVGRVPRPRIVVIIRVQPVLPPRPVASVVRIAPIRILIATIGAQEPKFVVVVKRSKTTPVAKECGVRNLYPVSAIIRRPNLVAVIGSVRIPIGNVVGKGLNEPEFILKYRDASVTSIASIGKVYINFFGPFASVKGINRARVSSDRFMG